MIKFLILGFLFFTAAMPTTTEIGILKAKLYRIQDNSPLANQEVVIMVFQNEERVLMLNKKTDAKGIVVFKNIFADSAFTYAVGTMEGEKPYVIPSLSLKPGNKEISVELPVGEGSPYDASQMMMEGERRISPGDPGMAPSSSGGENPQFTASSFLGTIDQKIAMTLSLLVIIGGVLLAARGKRV